MNSTFHDEEKTKEKLCEFIMKSEKLSMGQKCKEFEKAFSNYQGRKYSVLFNSGSSANLALIQSLVNLKKLDESDKVGFSAITWSTNVMPLIQANLDSVPVDISEKHLNIDSKNLLSVLNNTPLKALFLTNLLGFSGDIDKIKDICAEKKIILLEDNCESLGSFIAGKKLGNFGLASTFSFFVGHHLSTIEGGMVCTDDEELYDMLRMVRAHGWSRELEPEKQDVLREKYNIEKFYDKYTFHFLGYNLRPTEITGFLGLEILNHADKIIKKRNENYKAFDVVIKANPDFLHIDVSHMDFVSNFSYPLLFSDKPRFEKYKKLFEKSVEIRPIVGGYIVDQPFFIDYMKKRNLFYECPVAKNINKFGFYFPNNHELTNAEIEHLCQLLRSK